MSRSPTATGEEADKPIIVIKSDHKWPERVVFDMSAQTIVPQMPPLAANAPVTKPPREAFAMLSTPIPKVSDIPPPDRTKRKVAKRASHSRWRPDRPAARAEALPAGW